MGSSLVLKYDYDRTGVSPNNLVMDELHDLSLNQNRALVANYGPFYTESVIITDMVSGRNLVPHVDYLALQLYPTATAEAGLEVCGIIMIINSAVGNQVSFTGQMVGGGYSSYAYALQQMIQDLSIDATKVSWNQIIGKPSQYPPAPHLHGVDDVYGWEVLTSALDDLRTAILQGDQQALDALRATMISRFQLYQPVLGFVPVEQGASAGVEVGKIVLADDGDGNINGSLNGVYLGQVLFSSSQINDTLAALQAQVNALATGVTYGAVNITPADGSAGVIDAPVLTGDDYYPRYGIPQKRRQFQLISQTGTFDSPIIDTSLVPSGTGLGSGATLNYHVDPPLASSAAYAWRYRDQTIKNDFSVWSAPTFFNTSSSSVVTPSITSPATGTINSGPTPTIVISPFATTGGISDTLEATSVRVLDSTGTVVWSQDQSTTKLNNVTIPGGYLLAGQKTYTVQARYFGVILGASQWSAPITITTAASYVSTPTILSPTANQLITTLQPSISISTFGVAIGSDTLKSTSVRVLNSLGAVVWEQDYSTTQLNNVPVPAGKLITGNTYTVQARYTGLAYGDSGWSPAVTFRTSTAINTTRQTSAQTITAWTSSSTTSTSYLTSISKQTTTAASRSTTTTFNTTASKTTTWTSAVQVSRTTSQLTTRVSSYTTTYQTSLTTSRSTTRTSSYTTTFVTGVALSRNTTTFFNTSFTVCVAEGTMIELPNGTEVAVETLAKGNDLASFALPGLKPETVEDYRNWSATSLEGAVSEDTTISSIVRDVVPMLYNIWAGGKSEPLRVTPDHPLLVEDVDGTYRFCSADQLTLDDRLLDKDLVPTPIDNIETEEGSFVIYKVDCGPLDIFVHDGFVGHNLKLNSDGTSSPPHTTSKQTSQVTLTSWTSYFNTSNVTSVVVTYTTSFLTYFNTSNITSVPVNYTTYWTTTYTSNATNTRSTTTTFSTTGTKATAWTSTKTTSTSFLTQNDTITTASLSRSTTTTFSTAVTTNI